jgi:hypothetical protein
MGKIKGNFFGRLDVRYINGREWKIINPNMTFGFQIDGASTIIPPDGMITDFASIPRAFWHILPPVGDGSRARYGLAAIIHDFLYQTGHIDGVRITRRYADDVFLACMESLEVEPWKRNVMHWAVKTFGGGAWKRHNKHK